MTMSPSPSATAPHPGPTLKAVRLEQGLTLRALADRTGLPFSTVSKLENGKMTLTYDKLTRLAQGLGVDVARLVSVGAETPLASGRRLVSRREELQSASSRGNRHRYPAADLLGKLMEPIIIDVVAASIDEVAGLIRHSGEEYLYVLTGEMELHSDLYAPLTLRRGDSIYFDCGMAHAYVRVGSEPCQVLSVNAGAGIKPFAEAAHRALLSEAGHAGEEFSASGINGSGLRAGGRPADGEREPVRPEAPEST